MVVKKPEEQPDTWLGDNSMFEKDAPVVPDRDFLTVTMKAGAGYDAPWLVNHANSVEEALEFLQHPQLEELMDLAARRGREFAKAFGSGPAAKPAASGGSSWGKPKPAAKPASTGEAPDCEHGERTWVDKGAWRAWMCPAERDDPSKCDPIWANPDGSPQPAKKRR